MNQATSGLTKNSKQDDYYSQLEMQRLKVQDILESPYKDGRSFEFTSKDWSSYQVRDQNMNKFEPQNAKNNLLLSNSGQNRLGKQRPTIQVKENLDDLLHEIDAELAVVQNENISASKDDEDEEGDIDAFIDEMDGYLRSQKK